MKVIINMNNFCYNECPFDTHAIDNEYLCLNETPEGYYLDLTDSFFKKCFSNCKICSKGGNETYNNCSECKSNFIFINNSLNNMNCYEKCLYYYYFDKSNNYKCTENSTCPQGLDKLILYKKKCIDECRKDDIFQYEFNNICFDKCPNGTIYDNDNYNLI